jgi:hypothetical protein
LISTNANAGSLRHIADTLPHAALPAIMQFFFLFRLGFPA